MLSTSTPRVKRIVAQIAGKGGEWPEYVRWYSDVLSSYALELLDLEDLDDQECAARVMAQFLLNYSAMKAK